ncbi:MAG: acyl carrier protein [Burkholderiaceae bacterium]|nr:MAG: acyl carrier protein [Burkholderiaceae bacterium]
MNTDIYTTLTGLLEQKFHLEPARLRPDVTLEELGLDSLSLMDFIFNAEDAYRLRIPEELLDPRQSGITLQHICEVIEGQLAAQPAPAQGAAA